MTSQPPIKTRLTASEFLALPESNLPIELINGEVIMSPTPVADHQRLVGRLFKLLDRAHAKGEAFIAPLDVYLDESNVLQPDVLWIAAEGSACSIGADGKLHGPPDLVIEVFSPSTKRYDMKEKFHLYERFGVKEYWMVDPETKLVQIWVLREGKFIGLAIVSTDENFTSPLIGQIEAKAIFSD